MNHSNCSPAPFAGIERDVNDLFRGFFAGAHPAGTPPIDIRETDRAYEIAIDLPGRSMEAIDLSFAEKTLRVKVAAGPKADADKESTWHRRGRRLESVDETIRFPKPIDADAIEASLEAGVLTIALPKSASVQPRSIQIRG